MGQEYGDQAKETVILGNGNMEKYKVMESTQLHVDRNIKVNLRIS